MLSPRRSLIAVGAVAIAWVTALPIAAPAFLAAGCAGDDCDSDTQTWGSCSQGEKAGGDPNTWESGPVSGAPYLNFHGERTWVLDPTPWMGSRQPIGFQAYLAFNPLPDVDGGDGFAQPAGNLVEYTLLPSGKVQVLNDTCAQYYLRVVLTYAAVDGGASGAGTCSVDGGS
jgi:hypothetical protein